MFVRLGTSWVRAAVGAAAALGRGQPVQEGIYSTGDARSRLRRAVDDFEPDLVVIQMVRCGWAAEVAAQAAPGVPTVFDAIDCMSLHYRRAAQAAAPPFRSAYRFEAARCGRREAELVRRADVTTAVAGRDLEHLRAGSRGMVVAVAGGVETTEAGEGFDGEG